MRNLQPSSAQQVNGITEGDQVGQARFPLAQSTVILMTFLFHLQEMGAGCPPV